MVKKETTETLQTEKPMEELKRILSVDDLRELDTTTLKSKGKALTTGATELEVFKGLIASISMCETCQKEVLKKADEILENIDVASSETSKMINEKSKQLKIVTEQAKEA